MGEGLGLPVGDGVKVPVTEALGLLLPVGVALLLGSGSQPLEAEEGTVPGGQGAHHEAPSPGAYSPGPQGVQSLEPGALEKVPLWHGTQGAVAPETLLAVPMEHGMQCDPMPRV